MNNFHSIVSHSLPLAGVLVAADHSIAPGLRHTLLAAAANRHVQNQIIRVVLNDSIGLLGIECGSVISGARVSGSVMLLEGFPALRHLVDTRGEHYELLELQRETVAKKLKQSLGINFELIASCIKNDPGFDLLRFIELQEGLRSLDIFAADATDSLVTVRLIDTTGDDGVEVEASAPRPWYPLCTDLPCPPADHSPGKEIGHAPEANGCVSASFVPTDEKTVNFINCPSDNTSTESAAQQADMAFETNAHTRGKEDGEINRNSLDSIPAPTTMVPYLRLLQRRYLDEAVRRSRFPANSDGALVEAPAPIVSQSPGRGTILRSLSGTLNSSDRNARTAARRSLRKLITTDSDSVSKDNQAPPNITPSRVGFLRHGVTAMAMAASIYLIGCIAIAIQSHMQPHGADLARSELRQPQTSRSTALKLSSSPVGPGKDHDTTATPTATPAWRRANAIRRDESDQPAAVNRQMQLAQQHSCGTLIHRPIESRSNSDLIVSGYAALTKKKYKRAIIILAHAVRKNPDDPQARKYLAYAYLMSQKWDDAGAQLDAWALVETIPPTDLQTFANAFLSAGKNAMAAQVLDKLVRAEPDNTAARILLIRATVLAGQAENARRICLESMAKARDPGEYDKYVSLMPQ